MARSYHLSPRSLKSLALSDPLSARLPRRWPRRRPARPARSLPACSRSRPPAPATVCSVALQSPCSCPLDRRRSSLPELLPGRPSFPADPVMVNSMRSACRLHRPGDGIGAWPDGQSGIWPVGGRRKMLHLAVAAPVQHRRDLQPKVAPLMTGESRTLFERPGAHLTKGTPT
jgi:hypothetical protein